MRYCENDIPCAKTMPTGGAGDSIYHSDGLMFNGEHDGSIYSAPKEVFAAKRKIPDYEE
jgi:hypothetical protein